MDDAQRKLAEELLFSEKKKPSFAKQLYFGLFDSKAAFPYPKVSPEEKKEVDALVAKFEEFADKSLDADWIDRNGEIPQEVVQGLGKLGILSLTIPKQYGGLGMSQYAYCRVMEAVSKRCGSTALFINAHQSVGLKALLLFGTDAQKDKWLPPLGKGEALAAFSLTEPNAGSDAAGVQTRAIYDPEKKVYRITGDKQWTTNGSIAQILTVMARTEIKTPKGMEDKITAFLVTPDMPGFQVTAAALEKVGYRGSKTANIHYENVEVPEENILGPLGAGLRVCLTVLDYGRVTFGAMCTGVAKDLVKRAYDHAIHRYQFKRPLASFPLVKEKLVRMSALLYAMESTTYLTAGFIDRGDEDVMLESAILKVFASESLWTILYDTMQIFGGRSFFTTLPLERMMRDARINMIGEGSNEVLRAFIGLVGMRDVGVWLKTSSELFKNPVKNWNLIKKNLEGTSRYLFSQTLPIKSKHLLKEAKELSDHVRNFGISVVKVLAFLKEDVIERQLVLNRIAESAIAIYTATAVLSRIESEFSESSEKPDVEIAKAYLRMAFSQIKMSLASLFSEEDKKIEMLSDKITGVHFP